MTGNTLVWHNHWHSTWLYYLHSYDIIWINRIRWRVWSTPHILLYNCTFMTNYGKNHIKSTNHDNGCKCAILRQIEKWIIGNHALFTSLFILIFWLTWVIYHHLTTVIIWDKSLPFWYCFFLPLPCAPHICFTRRDPISSWLGPCISSHSLPWCCHVISHQISCPYNLEEWYNVDNKQ